MPDLEKYKDERFYEEHPTILFRTIWGNEQYQIFAAFTTPVIQEMILIITVLSKQEQWMIIKNLLLPLRKVALSDRNNSKIQR